MLPSRMVRTLGVHGERQTGNSAPSGSSRARRERAELSGRTLLGTTAGTTVLLVGGSLLLWPLSDLYLGPMLIEWGLCSGAKRRAAGDSRRDCPQPTITIACGKESDLIRETSAEAQRATIYISLRETTTCHDLFMAISSGSVCWCFHDACVRVSRTEPQHSVCPFVPISPSLRPFFLVSLSTPHQASGASRILV